MMVTRAMWEVVEQAIERIGDTGGSVRIEGMGGHHVAKETAALPDTAAILFKFTRGGETFVVWRDLAR